MATRIEKFSSPEFLSRYIVIGLLVLILVVIIIAMFATTGANAEMDWIGMTVGPLSTEGAAAQGIPLAMGGVVVGEVEGIAKKSGLQGGDVVLGINGQPVQNLSDFSKITGKTDISKGGVQLDIIRKGARIPLYVQSPGFGQGFAGQPGRPLLEPAEPVFAIDRKWLGIEAESFISNGGRQFGIPAGVQGALIEGVSVGSRAEKAGLAARDVLVSVNGLRLNSTRDLWRILGGLNHSDRIEFGLYRSGRLLAVELPAVSATVVGGFPVWGGGRGLSPARILICPSCRTKVTNKRGIPCFSVLCPSCGTAMIRMQ